MLILAILLALCFTIMLDGRGLLALGAGRALNSRLLAASSSSFLSFASLSALRLAAIASPGRENVGWVGGFVDLAGAGGIGNCTDTGRRLEAR